MEELIRKFNNLDHPLNGVDGACFIRDMNLTLSELDYNTLGASSARDLLKMKHATLQLYLLFKRKVVDEKLALAKLKQMRLDIAEQTHVVNLQEHLARSAYFSVQMLGDLHQLLQS